jgi:hypothetical protein
MRNESEQKNDFSRASGLACRVTLAQGHQRAEQFSQRQRPVGYRFKPSRNTAFV